MTQNFHTHPKALKLDFSYYSSTMYMPYLIKSETGVSSRPNPELNRLYVAYYLKKDIGMQVLKDSFVSRFWGMKTRFRTSLGKNWVGS